MVDDAEARAAWLSDEHRIILYALVSLALVVGGHHSWQQYYKYTENVARRARILRLVESSRKEKEREYSISAAKGKGRAPGPGTPTQAQGSNTVVSDEDDIHASGSGTNGAASTSVVPSGSGGAGSGRTGTSIGTGGPTKRSKERRRRGRDAYKELPRSERRKSKGAQRVGRARTAEGRGEDGDTHVHLEHAGAEEAGAEVDAGREDGAADGRSARHIFGMDSVSVAGVSHFSRSISQSPLRGQTRVARSCSSERAIWRSRSLSLSDFECLEDRENNDDGGDGDDDTPQTDTLVHNYNHHNHNHVNWEVGAVEPARNVAASLSVMSGAGVSLDLMHTRRKATPARSCDIDNSSLSDSLSSLGVLTQASSQTSVDAHAGDGPEAEEDSSAHMKDFGTAGPDLPSRSHLHSHPHSRTSSPAPYPDTTQVNPVESESSKLFCIRSGSPISQRVPTHKEPNWLTSDSGSGSENESKAQFDQSAESYSRAHTRTASFTSGSAALFAASESRWENEIENTSKTQHRFRMNSASNIDDIQRRSRSRSRAFSSTSTSSPHFDSSHTAPASEQMSPLLNAGDTVNNTTLQAQISSYKSALDAAHQREDEQRKQIETYKQECDTLRYRWNEDMERRSSREIELQTQIQQLTSQIQTMSLSILASHPPIVPQPIRMQTLLSQQQQQHQTSQAGQPGQPSQSAQALPQPLPLMHNGYSIHPHMFPYGYSLPPTYAANLAAGGTQPVPVFPVAYPFLPVTTSTHSHMGPHNTSTSKISAPNTTSLPSPVRGEHQHQPHYYTQYPGYPPFYGFGLGDTTVATSTSSNTVSIPPIHPDESTTLPNSHTDQLDESPSELDVLEVDLVSEELAEAILKRPERINIRSPPSSVPGSALVSASGFGFGFSRSFGPGSALNSGIGRRAGSESGSRSGSGSSRAGSRSASVTGKYVSATSGAALSFGNALPDFGVGYIPEQELERGVGQRRDEVYAHEYESENVHTNTQEQEQDGGDGEANYPGNTHDHGVAATVEDSERLTDYETEGISDPSPNPEPWSEINPEGHELLHESLPELEVKAEPVLELELGPDTLGTNVL